LPVLGLLLATRYLALHGAPEEGLRPLRRFTLFVSVVTLALNIAEPLMSGDYGKTAFDAIGWAEVGPGMLQSVSQITRTMRVEGASNEDVVLDERKAASQQDADDLDLARQADARHWATRRRPISADTLRTE
jgi:hypothetical protein